ncbi:MAG TPA: histidine kinase [Roseiflexaceae bacterium]|nr:histidine kinase [Roseiflexaceae bacterium]HMP39737.1 histidine kinase [Roseiflexaceae bacterium]
MSWLRSSQLADHTIFTGYRWIAWGITAIWLLFDWPFDASAGVALIITALMNLPATLFARQYAAIARANPSVMALDILFTVIVLITSGGWESPFLLYSYASLVMPALLFGWRGGLMAGLSYVTLSLAGLWAAGSPAADRVLEGLLSGVQLVAMMIVPPLVGCLVAFAVESARRLLAATRRSPPPAAGERETSARQARLPGSGLGRSGRAERAGARIGEAALTAQVVRIRTSEQGLEDLRRTLFAPFPAAELDLPAAIELLAERFEQQTGAATRVALLGRIRAPHPVHAELLIRLTQEALLNIRQHAAAGHAALTLRFDATTVSLLVQDDGVGLVDGTYERPGLHALRAMHYRLAEFDGRLDVFETEGGGVTVRATIPLA